MRQTISRARRLFPRLLLAAAVIPRPARAATPCDDSPRNHAIEVDARVSCKTAGVSKKADHRITWESAKGTTLKIEFQGASPFPNLSCQPANVCRSGRIAANAAPASYDYRIWLGGREIDPKVIVNP